MTVCGPWTSRCSHPLSPPVVLFPLGDSSARSALESCQCRTGSDFTPHKRGSAAPVPSPGAGHGQGGSEQDSSYRVLGRDALISTSQLQSKPSAFQRQGICGIVSQVWVTLTLPKSREALPALTRLSWVESWGPGLSLQQRKGKRTRLPHSKTLRMGTLQNGGQALSPGR